MTKKTPSNDTKMAIFFVSQKFFFSTCQGAQAHESKNDVGAHCRVWRSNQFSNRSLYVYLLSMHIRKIRLIYPK